MGVIFGAIIGAAINIFLSLIKFAANIFKKILIVTRLIVPFTYAVIFALLFLFGVIPYKPLNILLVCLGGVILTVYVYYRMVRKKIKKTFVKEKPQNNVHINKAAEKPKIYRVKQNPQYIMYEYSDRVELYKETEKGLLYIRTDFPQ